MRNKLKIRFVFAFLSLQLFIFPQDSLYFTNKSVVVAKISEIGISEIKYQRFDNLSGPTYVTSKSEIYFIKFANGKTDTLMPLKKAVVKETQSPVLYNQTTNDTSYVTLEPPKIEIKSHNRLAYNNRGLGENKFAMLIENFPNKAGKEKMQTEWKVMKRHKSGQLIAGFLGLGLGLAAPITGIIIGADNATYNNATTEQTLKTIGAGFGSGIVLGIMGATISTIFKSKRNKKKLEIARMYNEMR